ncbi:PREDICTED: MATH domain and coiled-coil domain-containing protein At3g58260-like [Lupinus angustifolius]|uniref:MATH domain and coiled-coil domain-containing protein At3g58260-like n=1 Tax=Lupinus angustifolius TaxID=3871 RepID=UPI00092F4474|nr:PREDICTED: MATH domain and coiled-coil domain-containing protein At3g58260-like [Lupinus angustifolius]
MSLQSKEFQIQGCNWRIDLYPLRKDVKHFSLYLMVADSFRAYLWDRTTHFKLTLINQVDGNKSVVKESQQIFNGRYRSCGWPFLNLNDFLDSQQGYLVNDTCIIEAYICVSHVALNTNIQNENLKNIVETNGSTSGKQEIESSDESERHSSTTCESSQKGKRVQGSDSTLRDTLDFEKLREEEKTYVPLSLGKVLHFLNTTKARDMNEDACNQLRNLWDEINKSSSGFYLTWLEPHVQNALGVKAQLERSSKMKTLRNSVVAMEIKMLRLRGELAATEAEFKVASKTLIEAREGFTEMDFDVALDYELFR